jgi:hypothetical protein
MPLKKRKVFCIGMFKTGTTSFGEAMTLLGYPTKYRFMGLLDNLSGYFDLDPGQFLPFEKRIRDEANRYDAFADSPWLYLYRELDHWYPESLFVLTLRSDSESVARSEFDWWERKNIMPDWLREVGKPPTAQMFIERYERHNENVRHYFRDKRRQLLQVCWELEANPWERLCDFLGVDVPNSPFPHANRAPG